ncbi:MAG: ATP-binding cassette domain-containing protein [Syntrophobacteraceae bacterium]
MTGMLEVRSLTKRFGGLVANDDISFEAARGELLGIIGPNGPGKTTLFNCVAGVYRADSGSIFFEGRDITSSTGSHSGWNGARPSAWWDRTARGNPPSCAP